MDNFISLVFCGTEKIVFEANLSMLALAKGVNHEKVLASVRETTLLPIPLSRSLS